ncbi:hypothetical protein GY45DRAFT_809576 [Cubamyces sp. BRFM 1775]|nr:hypothetical protein GY45DRAFT_809576 [Cubamyces sp. BRFM 1775]
MADAAFYSELFVEGCCDMAAFALIFYEYCITLDREVALIWGRKFTGATVLFILNRYLALFKYPIYIVDLVPISDKLHHHQYPGQSVGNTALRCVDLVLYVAHLCHMPTVLENCAARGAARFCTSGDQHLPVLANVRREFCATDRLRVAQHGAPPHLYQVASNSLLIFTRSSVITADVLVLLITWWKTYDIRKLAAQTDVKVSLTSLILRDGTIYFLVLLYMNTIHIVLSLTGRFTFTITFEEPLTTILVSRFLLNLREVNEMRGSTDSADYDMSRPSFVRPLSEIAPEERHSLVASFIAPLGAPLAHSSFLADEPHGGPSGGYDDTELVGPVEDEQEAVHSA